MDSEKFTEELSALMTKHISKTVQDYLEYEEDLADEFTYFEILQSFEEYVSNLEQKIEQQKLQKLAEAV